MERHEDTKTPVSFMDWAETKLNENKKLSPIKSKRALLHTQNMYESRNFNKGEQISMERKATALKKPNLLKVNLDFDPNINTNLRDRIKI